MKHNLSFVILFTIKRLFHILCCNLLELKILKIASLKILSYLFLIHDEIYKIQIEYLIQTRLHF